MSFVLAPLIEDVFASRNESRDPFSPPQHRPSSLRLLDAAHTSLWAGTSDGSVLAFESLPGLDDKLECTCTGTRRLSPNARPVEKLAALDSLDRLLVLCDNTLSFYSLSSLSPVQHPQPIRGVLTFAVDSNSYQNHVRIAVVKREGVILCALTHNEIRSLYEQTLDSSVYLSVLRGTTLCAANVHEYFIVDFATQNTVPLVEISQSSSSAGPSPHQRPAIAAITTDEFLIASHTDNSTLGVFVRPSGEPSRGTLQWTSSVRAISVDFPHVIALLSNSTVEIHSLDSSQQQLVQIVQIPSASEPRTLAVCSTSPFKAVSGTDEPRLNLVPIVMPSTSKTSLSHLKQQQHRPLSSPSPNDSPETPQNANTTISSEFSFMSSPASSSVSGSNPTTSPPTAFSAGATAKTLILGKTSVHALFPVSLLVQAESLWKKRKFEEVLDLVSRHLHQQQQQSSSSSSSSSNIHAEISPEILYIYQYTAFRYLYETKFEQAGQLFLNGKIDPRYLIRLFPKLCPTRKHDEHEHEHVPEIQIYQGLTKYTSTPKLQSIADIISNNLNKNYSPHVKPDVDSAESTRELARLLYNRAVHMLKIFLLDWKTEQHPPGHPNEPPFDVISEVDTTIAKILSTDKNPDAMINFIDTSPYCSLDQLSDYLQSEHQIGRNLADIYLRVGKISDALDIWRMLFEPLDKDDHALGEISLEKIAHFAGKLTERSDLLSNGIWLLRRDRVLGMHVILRISVDSEDDAKDIMARLRETDVDAADMYMEYSLFVKGNKLGYLHDELISSYMKRIKKFLSLENNIKLAQEQAHIFSAYSPSSISDHTFTFVGFLLSSQPQQQSNDHDNADDDRHHLDSLNLWRIKLILLLQESQNYDVTRAKLMLESSPTSSTSSLLLSFELGVVCSKLGLHDRTLSLLVNNLCDFSCAEIYCSTAGSSLITPHVKQAIYNYIQSLLVPFTPPDEKETHHKQQQSQPSYQFPLSLSNHNNNINTTTANSKKRPSNINTSTSTSTTTSTTTSSTSTIKLRKELFGRLVDVCLVSNNNNNNNNNSISVNNLNLNSNIPTTVIDEKEQKRRRETSRVINTQAMNLETLHVLERVPDDWPLQHLHSFLERSLRRDYTARNQASMMKALSLQQNFRIHEVVMQRQRDIGPTLITNDNDDFVSSSSFVDNTQYIAKRALHEDELKREKE